MQRVTISLDDALAAQFDAVVRARNYQSRSEAVRDLVRREVDDERLDAAAGGACVASLSYVYDYRTRALAQRLLAMQHAHHDLVVTSNHVILDHASLLETLVLRGAVVAVMALADAIVAERGVRFGKLNAISVGLNDDHSTAPTPHHHHHGHDHASPHPG